MTSGRSFLVVLFVFTMATLQTYNAASRGWPAFGTAMTVFCCLLALLMIGLVVTRRR